MENLRPTPDQQPVSPPDITETFIPVSDIKIEAMNIQPQPETETVKADSPKVEPDALESITSHHHKPPVGVLVTGGVSILLMMLIGGMFYLLSKGNNQLANSIGLGEMTSFGVLILSLAIVTGVISVLAFIGMLISIFKFMNTKRDDIKSKKRFLIIAGATLATTLVFGSIAYFSFINIHSNGPVKKMEVIKTSPQETTGLSAPVTIIFDASMVPIDLTKYKIISYNWDFGDKEQATGPTVNHTFSKKPASGIYTVKLKVSFQDKNDPTAEIKFETFERVVSIENDKVMASFSYEPKQATAPAKINFDATASRDPDGEIVNYEWDFNEDGIYDAEGVKAEHNFERAGTFNVTLRVTDSNGEYSNSSIPVIIKGDKTIDGAISITPNDEVLAPDRAYQFDASEFKSAEGTVSSYDWNFGDGKLSTGRKITHTFTKEGVYEISVKLKDDKGNQRTISKNYTVSSSPSGLFARIQTTPQNTSGTLKGIAPFRVNFDAGNSSGGQIVEYNWDFNSDGIIDAKGQIVEHVFTSSTNANVTLSIVSVDGKTAVTTMKTDISGTGLQSKVIANPVNGIVPLLVNFDASATIVPEGSQIATFQWDFGDGTPILREGPIVAHKYTSVGTFTASVTAITSDNKTSVSKVTIFVNSTPLKACYTMSRTVGPAPLTVAFNPQCSTGTIDQYSWNFGGLGVSTERKANFTFQSPGQYEVELEIVDTDNNVSKFKETVTVQSN